MSHITVKTEGHILLIGLNRPEKMNAFSWAMLRELAEAYTSLEHDENLRCGLLYAHGDHFTSGLDLADVAPHVNKGEALFPEGKVGPLGLYGEERTKPVVVAVQGYCLTIAIELILASDICIASDTATFGQIEIKRGIFPFGGATLRFPQVAGWGNAMRYLLTGDRFDAREGYRLGLVQEVVEGPPFKRALEIATRIAGQAPLGVYATLQNARIAREKDFEAARKDLMPTILRLMDTEDAAEGLQSFLERRKAKFQGK